MSFRIRFTSYAAFAAFLVPPISVHAAGLSASQVREISEVATAALETQHLPGLSVAISKGGQIWSAGFGKADLEQEVPVTAQSMFRTASVAKWFTAAAAMRLADDGKLDLDAPIQRYCAAFPVKPWPITSRQLLTHMAGISHNHGDNGEKSATDAERQALDQRIQRERSGQYVRYTDVIKPLDAFKDDPLIFRPGTRVQYSSLGYRLLGCVLEGAAKMPYRKLMRDLVFTPAGMQTITEDDALALVPHRVAGYSKSPDGAFARAAFRDVSENLPAGGWLSTAEDLVRFAVAFQSGTLVKPATRDRMLERPSLLDGTPAPNPFGSPNYYYGVGIMVGPLDGRRAWFHTGGQSGASTLLFWFPDSQIAVALMTNRDGSAIREPLARKLEEIAGRESDRPAPPASARLQSADNDGLAERSLIFLLVDRVDGPQLREQAVDQHTQTRPRRAARE
jgi:CubicO group peptidase (beta-lactamase class C family)